MKRRSIYGACNVVGSTTIMLNVWIHEHPTYHPLEGRLTFLLAVIGAVAYAIAFGINLESDTPEKVTQQLRLSCLYMFIAFSVCISMIF